MERWRVNAGTVVELPPMDGWREVVAVNPAGRIVARYWARHEAWDDVVLVLLAEQATRPLAPIRLVRSSPERCGTVRADSTAPEPKAP